MTNPLQEVKDWVEKKKTELAEAEPHSEVVMRFPIPEKLDEARIAMAYSDMNIVLWELKQILFELLDEGYSREQRIRFEENGKKLEAEEVVRRIYDYLIEEIDDRGIQFFP